MSRTLEMDEITDSLPEITAIRRDLHAHPELGFQEERTSALVAKELRRLGIEVVERVGGAGVVGTIRGSIAGTRAIGLRADMDALPIQEITGLPYASTAEGQMHACGHDGHTAMLLGAARYFAKHNDFAGTVYLIFQPAEETLKGALSMIEDGLLERFPCDAIYGLHTGPGIPATVFATLPGILMAGSGRFDIVFRGRGGHGGLNSGVGQELSLVQAQFLVELEAYVFGPLGMKDTSFTAKDWFNGRLARPYLNGAFSPPAITSTWNAADLVETTITDYGHFVASVMRNEGLSPTIAAERLIMTRDWTSEDAREQACTHETSGNACHISAGMGLGWQVIVHNGVTIVDHSGSDTGVTTHAFFIPSKHVGAVVFTNGDNGSKVIGEIVHVLSPDPVYAATVSH